MKKMKKTLLSVALAVVVGFLGAVGLCIHALSLPVKASTETNMRIVLDAGHGGIDGGVSGKTTGTKESEINLAITLKLKDKLEEHGFEVTLTRRTDAGLYGTTAPGFKRRDMQKRKEIIEKADPLLVISVHQNFFSSSRQRGGQVFYEEGNENGRAFATLMQERINALYETVDVKNRTEATGDYFMLHLSGIPSVIVECGFLSNEKDETLLLTADFQSKLASVMTAGVIAYLAKGDA